METNIPEAEIIDAEIANIEEAEAEAEAIEAEGAAAEAEAEAEASVEEGAVTE